MKNRNLNHKDNWGTPDDILDPLKKEFGEMFDPCPLNHNVNEWDGLKIGWKNINFINPPYSLKLKSAFVLRAIEEYKNGKTCILLIPVSTSTILFHDHILKQDPEIRFIKGRVKFKGIGANGVYTENKTGMHDSMIVILQPK